MWIHAIVELRLTIADPALRKESFYLLGHCFEQKGAFEKARQMYERLLAIDYAYRDTLKRLFVVNRQQPAQAASVTKGINSVQQQFPPILQDRYELLREIGRGGAGVVYQAIDLKLKRDIALKVLCRQGEKQIDHCLQEARLAAQLNHPNIIDIYDVNVEAQCIAMEFISGGTLRDLLKASAPLPLEQARSIVIRICRGLDAAHQAGVLHSDIKPRNIFVLSHQQIKIGDFGIAHITQCGQDAFAQLSAQIGTLPYMSPEQIRGNHLSAASDIYAVGVVLYEMLTGSPPFTRGDLAYHHAYTVPPQPGISEQIDAIVLRCLAKDPADRFQSVAALLQALQQQEKDEQKRLDSYRDLLKVALLDKDLSERELRVLKVKRHMLKISNQEAKRIEQDLGIDLP
jgi:serine/threonine protein kinase